jgi:hypothetical protein
MLSVGNTLGNSSGSLSLDTRVAVGAGVFAVSAAEVGAAEVSAPEPARVIPTPSQKIPAYNAIEFSYRPDFGKIILLQQNVETGQEVTQVPNEYHLRQYAATQREQRVQLQQKLYKSVAAVEQAAPQQAAVVTTAKPTGSTAAVQTSAPSTSASSSGAPAAAPPASPSVAPSAVAAATVAHVDIKA